MQKKEKKQLIITGVLVIIFIVALTRVLGKSATKIKPAPISKTGNSDPSDSGVTAKSSGPGDKYAQLVAEAQNYDTSRDPFSKKRVVTQEQGQRLDLMGISWDSRAPRAIINGKIVGRGSVLGEFYIVDIKKDKVIINDGNRTIELLLEL